MCIYERICAFHIHIRPQPKCLSLWLVGYLFKQFNHIITNALDMHIIRFGILQALLYFQEKFQTLYMISLSHYLQPPIWLACGSDCVHIEYIKTMLEAYTYCN